MGNEYNSDKKPLDTGLRGVRVPDNSFPDDNIVGNLKRGGSDRRADAFPESQKGSGYRPSGDDEAEDLRSRS